MKEIRVYDGDTVFCMMCPTPLTEDQRKKGQLTCCDEHKTAYYASKRRRADQKKCRTCGRRKLSPARRLALRRFDKLERQRPDLIYPAEFATWQEDQLVFAQANKDTKKKFETTPQAFAKYWSKKREEEEAKEETA